MVPRLALYGATSTVLAAAVIGSSLNSRPNFFAAAVTIGRSSGSLMVLANFALFNVICFGIFLKKVFFGQLRSIEYEHLFERLWLFLTESLLALTMFRDDFSPAFAFMYSLLLFLKCFHWISADRVDYMDQIPAPGPPRTFHLRLVSILSILCLLDFVLVLYSIESISYTGVTSMVLFASEFMILLASIWGSIGRYAIGVIDLRRARGREDAPSWEEKSMYIFYVDLAVDFVKLLTYLTFFSVILLNYGLPLHILRDVYMTFRSFLSRCSDLVRYRRATRDMDALYPNATAQEMETLGDRTCIICREEMVPQAEGAEATGRNEGPNETPKKLVCGHIFHFHCLRSWLERQQSCPTCRRDVLRTPARATVQRPPAPLPGQVPQQNPVHAGIQPTPDGRQGDADPMRGPMHPDAEAFFRHPDAHIVQPAGQHVDPQQRRETETDRLQTGIWGGPITPGRFFPTRLGAGPSSGFQFRAMPAQRSSPTPTNNAVAGPFPSTANRSSHTAPTPTATATASGTTSVPGGVSGSTTPFSSNPPQVFSPTGGRHTVNPSSPSDVDTEQSSSPAAPAASGDTTEEEKRRTVADAAMRRLGLRNPIRSSLSPITRSMSAVGLKGKEKAEEDIEQVHEPSQPASSTAMEKESLEDKPRVTPYLTCDLPPPHPQSNMSNLRSVTDGIGRLSKSEASSGGASGGTNWHDQETRRGLEERLKVLRDVDEVLWGLMGELVQVKSRWEAEDGQVKEDVGRPDTIDSQADQD